MNDNNYISKDELIKFKNSNLNLKKRKIEILNEANSYTEEVRRLVKENYGFEKLYSQGLSIRTPLNINYQIEAIKSLRKGIEEYDKRHGWRGPITNKIKDKKWEDKIKRYKLDPTLNWKFVEVISLDDTQLKFRTIDKNNKDAFGKIDYKNLKWTISKSKTISESYKAGDILLVKKEKNF